MVPLPCVTRRDTLRRHSPLRWYYDKENDMIAQLRTYTINKGMMDDWLKVFREDIVPLCRSMGIGRRVGVGERRGDAVHVDTHVRGRRGHRAQGSRHVRQRVVGRERHLRPQSTSPTASSPSSTRWSSSRGCGGVLHSASDWRLINVRGIRYARQDHRQRHRHQRAVRRAAACRCCSCTAIRRRM